MRRLDQKGDSPQIPPMLPTVSRDKGRARFYREFRLLKESHPRIARTLEWVTDRRWLPIRLPLAILLVLGSFLAILPVLGLWMFPTGLMLLAIDVPPLQRPVGRLMLWLRIRMRRLRRLRSGPNDR